MDKDKNIIEEEISLSNEQNEVSTTPSTGLSTEPSINNTNSNTELSVLETTLNNILSEIRQYQLPRTLHDTQNLRSRIDRVNSLIERLRSSRHEIRQQYVECMEHCLNEIRNIDANYASNSSQSNIISSSAINIHTDEVSSIQNIQNHIRNMHIQRNNDSNNNRRNSLPSFNSYRQRDTSNNINSSNIN